MAWRDTAKDCKRCDGAFLPTFWAQEYCSPCRANCAAPSCVRAAHSGGLCLMHYKRLKKHGDVSFGRRERMALGYPNRRARSPRVTLSCERCEGLFTVAASLAVKDGVVTRRFCSSKCATHHEAPTFKCASCGETTVRSKSKSGAYNKRQKHCSRSCADAANRTGGLDKNGYRIITVNGKSTAEHRHVMAGHLGRELFADETVHHIDGQRAHNVPSNLELWSSRHGKGQRVSDKISFAKSFLTDYGISHQVYMPTEVLAGLLGFGV